MQEVRGRGSLTSGGRSERNALPEMRAERRGASNRASERQPNLGRASERIVGPGQTPSNTNGTSSPSIDRDRRWPSNGNCLPLLLLDVIIWSVLVDLSVLNSWCAALL